MTIRAPIIRYVLWQFKGSWRHLQQTFVDTLTKVAFAKLYDRKTPIIAVKRDRNFWAIMNVISVDHSRRFR